MKFSESHEWISVEGEVGLVGISDYAQGELGDIVYVELPDVGKAVNAGEEIAVLESSKAASDIYSPVSGTIVEVNTALSESPEMINESPLDEGWIYKIQLADFDELDNLMDEEHYLSTIM